MNADDDEPTPASASELLLPQVRPPWLAPLVDNVDRVPDAYRRRVDPELLTALAVARSAARASRDAAVLVLPASSVAFTRSVWGPSANESDWRNGRVRLDKHAR